MVVLYCVYPESSNKSKLAQLTPNILLSQGILVFATAIFAPASTTVSTLISSSIFSGSLITDTVLDCGFAQVIFVVSIVSSIKSLYINKLLMVALPLSSNAIIL